MSRRVRVVTMRLAITVLLHLVREDRRGPMSALFGASAVLAL